MEVSYATVFQRLCPPPRLTTAKVKCQAHPIWVKFPQTSRRKVVGILSRLLAQGLPALRRGVAHDE
jgi:hypothetical protein